MSFSLEWDLSELAAACSDADGILETGTAAAISTGLDAGVSFAKANHKYTDRNTSDGLTSTIGVEGDALVAKSDHASFIEEGTPAHEISAKGKGSLRWFSGGEPVFRKTVNHPGTDAMPFLQPAAEHAAEIATATIESKVVADIQARFGK